MNVHWELTTAPPKPLVSTPLARLLALAIRTLLATVLFVLVSLSVLSILLHFACV